MAKCWKLQRVEPVPVPIIGRYDHFTVRIWPDGSIDLFKRSDFRNETRLSWSSIEELNEFISMLSEIESFALEKGATC